VPKVYKANGVSPDGKGWAFSVGDAELAKYFEEVFTANDRTAVIMSCSLLEELVRSLLEKFFVDDSSKNEIRDKFVGPYSDLSATDKVDLAYLLGLITKETRNLVADIGKIRNGFAHNHKLYTFADVAAHQKLKTTSRTLAKNIRVMFNPAETNTEEFLTRSAYLGLVQVLQMELTLAIASTHVDHRTKLKQMRTNVLSS
jgi:DNA-binding MltR family transcriptional regulator